MRGVLYVSHGSRVDEAVTEAVNFIESVKNQIDVPLQETCFLELTQPNVSQGFQRLVNKGATEISVIPVLLLSAGHYFKDIPTEIQRNQQMYPHVKVSYGKPLGVQRRLTEILHQRIEETHMTPNMDAKVLIVGRGSYNPQTQKDLSTIKAQLQDININLDIEVCYLAACGPSFEETLQDAVNKAHSQIFVVPYLWFTGILERHIATTIDDYQVEHGIVLCDRLGNHSHLQIALKERVEATFETVNQ
ncbi:MAG: sirohydrochlorin chelatase [Staphylococcus equorum]|uniref:sirohydrochlorin chelatase n=1 Tax=Staphylococcus TaxID=1279 RepID=UPI0008537A00|nr:sirohydrochlorin chelatase [Staphylococcus equorum]MDG0822585.1 sirohydrochlorin chelatase [Staphylococcus equorum]MDG0837232.1 sirohydrochlorin chelatase [Staphylococcus equorum]MDK9872653.1 sirohydrochlorin chelatase [Staphylococcus equorum]MDK9877325.1 sirohydrochlorin chelatase [Staphylococcus equorum]MDN5808575.1 sirohydrochlorin chelatase [Staphylococcus equorum]